MLEWLKKILGEAYTDEIDKEVSAEIGKAFVARSDFNALNEEKKSLINQLSERDTQLEELKKIDAKSLQAEITRLQGENKTAAEKYKADLEAVKLNAALDTAILSAKGKNAKAIKALLDVSKLKLKEDGSLEGLDLEALKTSDPYLFDEVQQSGNDGNNQQQSGLRLGSGANHGGSNNPEYDKMSDDEYYAAKAKENKS
jgi:hypothetical protein